MIRARGLPLTVIQTRSPREMIEAYREMDIVVCQMLHSSILATNAGVPSLCIAYDVKNYTFYKLFDLSEFCLSPDCSEQEGVTALQAIVTRRTEISRRLEARLAELHVRCEQFLNEAVESALFYRSERFATADSRTKVLSP
jgi:polysaccharide pyruvyl transferase WcaK-like protein